MIWAFLCCYHLRDYLFHYRKPIGTNVGCVIFIIVYSIIGGYIFMHFERPYANYAMQTAIEDKTACVYNIMEAYAHLNKTELSALITEYCFVSANVDERQIWNLKNAMLYCFGIVTTLGYGKVEPQTINGRIFTVIYGFIGVPITVIMFTNFGRYMQVIEQFMRKKFCCCFGRRKKNPLSGSHESLDSNSIDEIDQIPCTLLVIIVSFYLVIGALFIPYLNGKFDFFNGIYWSFLCFTAIEFGDLIPQFNYQYVPLVVLYICFGLALSTIALDLGSTYVRKLYFLGKSIGHMASVKMWFGAKELSVKELITALGQNMGLETNLMREINLEQLISDAIQVKEGKLSRVPQRNMLVDGIWPPELVPLFLKDGELPDFVDTEEEMDPDTPPKVPPLPYGLGDNNYVPQSHISLPTRTRSRTSSVASGAIRRLSRALSTASSRKGERLTVRFEDVVYSDADAPDFDDASIQHIENRTTTDVETPSAFSDRSSSVISYNNFNHHSPDDSFDSKEGGEGNYDS